MSHCQPLGLPEFLSELPLASIFQTTLSNLYGPAAVLWIISEVLPGLWGSPSGTLGHLEPIQGHLFQWPYICFLLSCLVVVPRVGPPGRDASYPLLAFFTIIQTAPEESIIPQGFSWIDEKAPSLSLDLSDWMQHSRGLWWPSLIHPKFHSFILKFTHHDPFPDGHTSVTVKNWQDSLILLNWAQVFREQAIKPDFLSSNACNTTHPGCDFTSSLLASYIKMGIWVCTSLCSQHPTAHYMWSTWVCTHAT